MPAAAGNIVLCLNIGHMHLLTTSAGSKVITQTLHKPVLQGNPGAPAPRHQTP